MTDEPITPALTPDQWMTISKWPEGVLGLADMPIIVASKHGVAAANLYRQPFGFTHEDIRVLRGEVRFLRAIVKDHGSADLLMSRVDLVESIADRIAALLPPRPTE